VVDLCPWNALRKNLRPLISSTLTSALKDVRSRLSLFLLLVNCFVGVAQRMGECQSWSIKDIVPLVRDLGRTVGEC